MFVPRLFVQSNDELEISQSWDQQISGTFNDACDTYHLKGTITSENVTHDDFGSYALMLYVASYAIK